MKMRSGIPEHKACTTCQKCKPAIAFSKSRNGLRASCKECDKEKKLARRAAPKEDHSADEGAINSAFRKWFGWVARTTLKQTV